MFIGYPPGYEEPKALKYYCQANERIRWTAHAPAIVLFSGGIDSTTLLSWVRHQRHRNAHIIALTIDYGQRNYIEITRAIQIINHFNETCEAGNEIEHIIHEIDLSFIRHNSLVDDTVKVPDHKDGQPFTNIVPFRNALFLLYACMYSAQTARPLFIYYGANADSQRVFPDCRPRFVHAFEDMVTLNREGTIYVDTPFAGMSKSEVIGLGEALKIPTRLTWTCYNSGPEPCGTCDACVKRESAMLAYKNGEF